MPAVSLQTVTAQHMERFYMLHLKQKMNNVMLAEKALLKVRLKMSLKAGWSSLK